ncbi:MAG: hypothetical protein ACI4PR_04360 [Acutalibacteraceae bacterium]
MQKTIKIFEDDKIIYERNLSVNTVLLKGRMSKNPNTFGETVHFTLEISNGKDSNTNEWQRSASPKGDTIRPKGVWRKPTYADCTAFGDLGSKILRLYKERDEIFVVCKFYSNTKDGKTYKGFTVREVINIKNEDFSQTDELNNDDDIPF